MAPSMGQIHLAFQSLHMVMLDTLLTQHIPTTGHLRWIPISPTCNSMWECTATQATPIRQSQVAPVRRFAPKQMPRCAAHIRDCYLFMEPKGFCAKCFTT